MHIGSKDILGMHTGIKFKIYWQKKVLDRELPIVQAIVVDRRRELKWQINVEFEQGLLRTTFYGYLLLKWTTDLEMCTEMKQFLIESRFTPEGTSKIYEGSASIIRLVIDDRKWAFEDVKLLICKGHDVNSSNFEPPFYVALRSHRYDIAKLLLLNGAKPLPTNPNYLHYFIYFRREAFYLLITCNSLLSVAVEGETLLRYVLNRHVLEYNNNILTGRGSSNPDMRYKDIILLIWDKIDIFCYEDRKALLDYQNDKSLPNEILEKIHTILYEPDSLMNICRKRLRRHYRCHFHRFIDILIDEAFPESITDYLQCKDLLLRYFCAEDIEALDNRLAGIS